MRHSNARNYHFDFEKVKIEEGDAERSSSPVTSVTISGRGIGITPVFFAYWKFATERQKIFFKRVCRSNDTRLTADPILAHYKFTNAYRASDRVSQYLIRNVIYRDDLPASDEEVFFRILLFKLFNKIETWELLEQTAGPITLRAYNFDTYSSILSERMAAGDRVYSAAYIMPSCGNVFGYRAKHQNHLRLLEMMLERRFPERLRNCATMEDAYHLMLSVPSIGPFLAYQYVTDLNYSNLTEFSESEFVVAGPGALDGIQKCFVDTAGMPPSDIIRFMFQNQDRYFSSLSRKFETLWGRPLQLIDCQNLFCEISKYARVAFPNIEGISSRKRIKQKFVARTPIPSPWYPPKWGINSKIVPPDQLSQESPTSEIASAVQLTPR